MKSEIATQVRFLLPGDTLIGSGFEVMRRPERGLRTPKGKVSVFGRYPGQGQASYREWSAYTQVRVTR